MSQRLDRDFETALLERVKQLGWHARPRVKRLDRLPLERSPGQSIGDVDVLAWAPERRQVWLLDAKRLAPALEANSITRESRTLSNHATHHLERLEWIRQHSDCLAVELEHAHAADWDIRAALVVDRPLAGAHLAQHALPVWTIWELPTKLAR